MKGRVGPGLGLAMKSTILGVMVALGIISSMPEAKAQDGHGGPAYAQPDWERERWQRHEEWRQRREFWRQQREMGERRAYEAGRRDALQRQHSWGYR